MKLWLLALLLLFGCGGGGGGPTAVVGAVTPAGTLRADLLFGYFGDCDSCALETGPHSNLYWAADWYGPDVQITNLQRARGAGFQHFVIALPAYDIPIAEARAWLKRLQVVGLLEHVDALYPIDEPNALADEDVRAKNAELRALMAEFHELKDTKLAVIYARAPPWPGLDSYDWIGFDDYNASCGVLGVFDEVGAQLRENQRLLLVPGGANPWRQDPACFESYAHRTARVVAIIPFIWFDNAARGVGAGIRSNGLRRLYCEAGTKIKSPGAPLTNC